MAKYMKTIKVNTRLYNLLASGKLKLQRGQWVQFDHLDTPSRWVGLSSGGSLWAVHTYRNESGALTMDGGQSRFQVMCQSLQR